MLGGGVRCGGGFAAGGRAAGGRAAGGGGTVDGVWARPLWSLSDTIALERSEGQIEAARSRSSVRRRLTSV